MDPRDTQTAVVPGVAAAGNLAVANIQLNDTLVSVQIISADPQPNLVDDFTITADGVVNNSGTGRNTLGSAVEVIWVSNYRLRHQFEIGNSTNAKRIGRSLY